jgi:hypothetical protein
LLETLEAPIRNEGMGNRAAGYQYQAAFKWHWDSDVLLDAARAFERSGDLLRARLLREQHGQLFPPSVASN